MFTASDSLRNNIISGCNALNFRGDVTVMYCSEENMILTEIDEKRENNV